MHNRLSKKFTPIILGLLIAVVLLFVDHAVTFQQRSSSISSRRSCRGRQCNDEELNTFGPVDDSQQAATSLKGHQRAAQPGWVTVLYWTNWFGDPWSAHFGKEDKLEEIGCPEHRCHFTYERNDLEKADFVFFSSGFDPEDMPPEKGQPNQHWVYSIDESPILRRISANLSRSFDLVQSYSSQADLPGYNGYFMPLNRTAWPSGTNKMDPESDVFKSYMKALDEGKTLQDVLEHMPQQHKQRLEDLTEIFETKVKIAALMSSHCPVQSKRVSVVNRLNKFLVEEVDVYGSCGTLECRDRHPTDPWCWKNLLAPNYLFYLAMENSLCDEYITEKLYNPLLYGLVPVVYGGANYSLYLPPHSFIDVQQHTPQQLAVLLRRISEDKAEYSRYHLWRAFWEPVLGGNVCATCRALHRLRQKVPRPMEDIEQERRIQEPCHPPNSPFWFPENAKAVTTTEVSSNSVTETKLENQSR